jgi:hypothetical protein
MTIGEKRMYLHDSLERIERMAAFIKSDINTTSDFVLERWSEMDWLKQNVNRIECLSVEIQNKLADWIKEGDNNTPAPNETSNCRELGS